MFLTRKERMLPSEDEFKQFLTQGEWKPDNEWIFVLDSRKFNKADIRPILEGAYSKKAKFKSEILEHPVVLWFDEQPAVNKAFPIRKSIPSLETPEQQLENLIISSENTYEANPWSACGSIKWQISRSPIGILFNLLRAFYAYLYTDHWKKMTERGRDYKKLLKATLNNIEELEAKQEQLKLLAAHSLDWKHRWENFLYFERQKAQLHQALENENFMFPAQRLDKTARERVLVYDIADAMRQWYGKASPARISHLMALEGIENPLDARTIERLLSLWKTKLREAHRMYRQSLVPKEGHNSRDT